MNEFESSLFGALHEAKMVSREIDTHDYDAYREAYNKLMEEHNAPNRWSLPEGVEAPDINSFKYPEPIVTEITHGGDEGDYERDLYEFVDLLTESKNYGVDIDEFGTAYFVEQYGGEGQGDQYWVVFKLVNDEGERFFKLDGYYASYSGGYYDELYEVFPKVVMRTEWGQ